MKAIGCRGTSAWLYYLWDVPSPASVDSVRIALQSPNWKKGVAETRSAASNLLAMACRFRCSSSACVPPEVYRSDASRIGLARRIAQQGESTRFSRQHHCRRISLRRIGSLLPNTWPSLNVASAQIPSPGPNGPRKIRPRRRKATFAVTVGRSSASPKSASVTSRSTPSNGFVMNP